MLIDLHTHTRFGSSCSYMEPAGLAREARRVGLGAVCITEHEVSWPRHDLEALSREGGILVLAGVEVDTELGSILVYGVPEPLWNVSSAGELRRLADRWGGFLVATHPFRQDALASQVPDVDEACQRPIFALVDAVEVFNGAGRRAEIDITCAVGHRLGLRGTGGSDAHASHVVGQCVTVLEREIATEAQFVEELRAGRFSALHRRLQRSF